MNEIRAFVIQSTPLHDWLNQPWIQPSTDGHCGLASFLIAVIKHHDQNWCIGEDRLIPPHTVSPTGHQVSKYPSCRKHTFIQTLAIITRLNLLVTVGSL